MPLMSAVKYWAYPVKTLLMTVAMGEAPVHRRKCAWLSVRTHAYQALNPSASTQPNRF